VILLVSGATLSGRRYLGHPHFGWLKTPANRNSVRAITDAGVPWACDNDCYVRLDRVAYLKMLRRIAGQPGLLWVTAPDVVADAGATLARFRIWRSALDYYGLPIAFVAQDGQESRPVPWEAIRCLFVGGSTGWKEGPHAARLIREAHARGKWVHVGRVNTLRRYWWLSSLPVDSIDGTCFSKWPDKYVPWMLRRFDGIQHRMEDLCIS
jgi:hypothetical protein